MRTMRTITEHQIEFNSEMIRAIMDCRKTVTRQVMKPQPIPIRERGLRWRWTPPEAKKGYGGERYPQRSWRCSPTIIDCPYCDTLGKYCPYGIIGDRLLIRQLLPIGTPTPPYIILEITDIRVEQLQDMHHKTEEFELEGFDLPPTELFPYTNRSDKLERIFQKSWNATNTKRRSWKSNPWVWRIEFKWV